MGDTGLWALNMKLAAAKEKNDKELKKKLQTCVDLVEKFLETGMDTLSSEKKYHFINKFSPKKCPGDQVSRAGIKILYSWSHYAPLNWFEHLKKAELE